jgi:hypothetical protein
MEALEFEVQTSHKELNFRTGALKKTQNYLDCAPQLDMSHPWLVIELYFHIDRLFCPADFINRIVICYADQILDVISGHWLWEYNTACTKFFSKSDSTRFLYPLRWSLSPDRLNQDNVRMNDISELSQVNISLSCKTIRHLLCLEEPDIDYDATYSNVVEHIRLAELTQYVLSFLTSHVNVNVRIFIANVQNTKL